MLDITKSLEANSDQINAVDLIGAPITVQIAKVTDHKDDKQPYAVVLVGHKKPWIPCKGMRRLMAKVWGTDAGEWAGRWVRLYNEPTATFGNDPVGGIRVSGLSHIEGSFTAVVPDSVTIDGKKKKNATYRVDKLTPPAPAVMEVKAFKAWIGDAMKRPENPWTQDQIVALLGCKSDEVPAEKRSELVAIMRKAPPTESAGGAE